MTLRLSDEFPDEFRFFCQKFIWASSRAGFYTRASYVATENRKPWQPFKRACGSWQHLYPQLVIDLAEKHLDFERFCRTADPKSQVKPRDEETACWLGTMAGPKTWADCFDLDSHDIIGWYGVPTRWHPSRNPFSGAVPLYDLRYLPVVRLPLAHFQKLKQFHAVFINRIWAFSSANLGFALWRIYQYPKNTQDRYDVLQRQLKAAGLMGAKDQPQEVYPRPPKSKTSLGKCHRRPCGIDSGIITENGIVTDPIEQIRCFMNPPPTPSFEAICQAIFSKLDVMYDNWRSFPEQFKLDTVPVNQRPEKVAELRADIEIVKDWLHSGCPCERTIVVVDKDGPEPQQGQVMPRQEPCPCPQPVPLVPSDSQYPPSFNNVDLTVINDSGQWVQFCVFLARHGFPCHDRFLEVVSTLAKWFAFVELHHLWPDRSHVKLLVKDFCLNKNNGFITRLNNGLVDEVITHVERVVDDAIESVTDEGKQVFAEIRRKRDNGLYPEVYLLEGLMSDKYLNKNEARLCPISCGLLTEGFIEDKSWSYYPDETPLPETLVAIIRQGFDAFGIRLRRNTAKEYPTLQAIARLVNYLYAGKNRGQRRASRLLLEQMGFPTSSRKKERIKKALVKAGVLTLGDYRAKSKSRLYCLSKEALEVLDQARAKVRTTG